MKLKLFTQKPAIDEEKEEKEKKEKKVQFLKNICSELSTNTSMPDEQKQKILEGALSHTGLTKNEVIETISSQYHFM
ncbi:TPA: hypothetical protein JAN90_02475 [Legionella pneumophila]|nr:hypothetical protein [Legionella pneumophila]HAT8868570.1 hypothetical protein [Legionella pneumophila subsp. pneumophila]HAT7071654.1 hypothetical protein [Legionella pneumophila]HAT8642417.1 hypothetical protein [Legionella pneumophila]HAT8889789.1 hypothetical protein [Legionella pneumophila subsp. pneumophila]HAT8931942.1 hypothetical protein [Legionella pneumophila subsp. pneumophila]